jgi:hypothetical protein
MPRFVILYHQMPADSDVPSHWDLMFDTGKTLRTWAVDAAPDQRPRQPARRLSDHRRVYLEYEGEIAGERGSVTRWDEGDYAPLPHCADDRWAVDLRGRQLCGRMTIEQRGDDQRWMLTLERDEAAT